MEKIMFSIRLAGAEVRDIPHPAKHRRLKRRRALAEGAVLGLPATGQAAARFLAVTVTLYFNTILNA